MAAIVGRLLTALLQGDELVAQVDECHGVALTAQLECEEAAIERQRDFREREARDKFPGDITDHDYQRETLLEILIRLFSSKLIDAIRQGMPRRYVAYADDLPLLRGRLDVTRKFTKLAASPQKLACRYDALSEEIELNRIMKAAVVRLAGIARSADNQWRLRELAFAYAEVSDVPIALLRWDTVVIDRTNARWQQLLNLAKLLLGQRPRGSRQ